MKKNILIVACDPYLAGIYGRKFERDHWDVEIAENLNEARQKVSISQPNALILDKQCTLDLSEEVRKLKSLPTLQNTKIIILAKESDRDEIQKARNAGASEYLLIGHFVPSEAVEKISDII